MERRNLRSYCNYFSFFFSLLTAEEKNMSQERALHASLSALRMTFALTELRRVVRETPEATCGNDFVPAPGLGTSI